MIASAGANVFSTTLPPSECRQSPCACASATTRASLHARDDLALISGLRILLPPYRGPDLWLYRGQGAPKPRTRSYGLSLAYVVTKPHIQAKKNIPGSLRH